MSRRIKTKLKSQTKRLTGYSFIEINYVDNDFLFFSAGTAAETWELLLLDDEIPAHGAGVSSPVSRLQSLSIQRLWNKC